MAGSQLTLRCQVLDLVEAVRALPYRWPGPPEAAAARSAQAGTCASKHALLAEELEALGVASVPLLMAGRLLPSHLREDPELAPGAGLVEMHECLRVETPWSGRLVVDITWDPPVLSRGFRGTLPWTGEGNMLTAIVPETPPWPVERSALRAEKEALRARLYAPEDRELRRQTLEALSMRFEEWRREARGRASSSRRSGAIASSEPS